MNASQLQSDHRWNDSREMEICNIELGQDLHDIPWAAVKHWCVGRCIRASSAPAKRMHHNHEPVVPGQHRNCRTRNLDGEHALVEET